MVAGVAGGVAAWLGVDAALVRAAFVVLAVGGGSGVVLYLIGVLAMPHDGAAGVAGPGAAGGVPRRPRHRGQGLGVGLVVVGTLLLARELGVWFGDAVAWPLVLAAAGLAVVWWRADADGREHLSGVAGRLPGDPVRTLFGGRVSVLRILAGAALTGAGIVLVLTATDAVAAARDGLLALTVAAAGVALVFGPWWWRLGRQLAEERRERVRSEERSEMAAHLHDSVLQTLALIQRNAGDARTVAHLARRQERELRSWLYGGGGIEWGNRVETALAAVAAEVEERHAVAVEVVVVGDCPLDDDLTALVLAAREAMVNAGKWSGAATVDCFAEVEDERVTVFVRDRGDGFDPASVNGDRKGIAESIRGRVTRRGGTAEVRSAPGEGTEVEVAMPRRRSA